MNSISRWMAVAVIMIAVAPAFAGGKATQMWKGELHDDATEDQVMKGAQKWLASARTMKGGKNLDAYVHFPVAVNAMGEHDAVFVVTAPTFKEWGKFWDGYKGSPAAKIDKANDEFVIAPDSGLWECVKVGIKK
jgi:hypothetical protein